MKSIKDFLLESNIDELKVELRDLLMNEISDKKIGKDYDIELISNPYNKNKFILKVYYVWNLFSEYGEEDFAHIIFKILENHQDDLYIKMDNNYEIGASDHKGKQLGRYTDHEIRFTFKTI